ncbi:histidine--tRNA ligase [bacterium]|nr:histidine--tRNA ligase [bacterium]
MNIKAVKGTDDILSNEMSYWLYIENTAREIFDCFCYEEIRTPIFEFTDLFKRSIGEVTDIVQKEMYSFVDNKERSISLRPEATAPVVRAVLEHSLLSNRYLQKLFYIGPMFRYERPQAGRKRQFHQIGVEALGSADPSIDAEVISLISYFFDKLDLGEVVIHINSSGCKSCRPDYLNELRDFIGKKLGKLCKDCNFRYEKNILRVLDCKNPDCIAEFTDIPAIVDYVCDDCKSHFEKVLNILADKKIKVNCNHKLVRGLDYYTRTVFEVTSSALGSQDAVGAGGRYDNLVEMLGGSSVPAIGFAVGVERIINILKARNKINETPERKGVFFVGLGDSAFDKIYSLVDELRKNGIKASFDYDKRSAKAQMRFADKCNFEKVVVIGDNEIAGNKVKIKSLETGEEVEVGLDKIKGVIK